MSYNLISNITPTKRCGVISNFSPSKKLQYHPTVNIISLLKSCFYRLKKKTTSIASGWIFHFHQPSYCRVNITSPNISAAFSGPWGFMRKGPMYLAVELGNDEKSDRKWMAKMMFMKFYEVKVDSLITIWSLGVSFQFSHEPSGTEHHPGVQLPAEKSFNYHLVMTNIAMENHHAINR